MCISDFSKCELVTLANTIAIALSNELSNEDITILSAFFNILGDSLSLLSIED